MLDMYVSKVTVITAFTLKWNNAVHEVIFSLFFKIDLGCSACLFKSSYDIKRQKMHTISRANWTESNFNGCGHAPIKQKLIVDNSGFFTLSTFLNYSLTDRFHNEHNKCIYMTQVIFPAAHEGSSVLLPSFLDHQIFTNHRVTINGQQPEWSGPLYLWWREGEDVASQSRIPSFITQMVGLWCLNKSGRDCKKSS